MSIYNKRMKWPKFTLLRLRITMSKAKNKNLLFLKKWMNFQVSVRKSESKSALWIANWLLTTNTCMTNVSKKNRKNGMKQLKQRKEKKTIRTKEEDGVDSSIRVSLWLNKAKKVDKISMKLKNSITLVLQRD